MVGGNTVGEDVRDEIGKLRDSFIRGSLKRYTIREIGFTRTGFEGVEVTAE